MTYMKQAFLAFAVILGANIASASPAWVCHLAADDVQGTSVGIGINFERMTGTGHVRCQSVLGNWLSVPVAIKLKGIGVGLGVSHTDSIGLVTTNVGVAHPSAMMGEWGLGLMAGGTLIHAGLGVDLSMRATHGNGIAAELGIMGSHSCGLEAKIQLRKLKITPIGKPSWM